MAVEMGVEVVHKSGDQFTKKLVESTLKLKGKRIKTYEKFGFNIDFPGLCLLKADVTALNTKFTNNHIGLLKLTSCGWKDENIQEVQIQGLENYLSKPSNQNDAGMHVSGK